MRRILPIIALLSLLPFAHGEAFAWTTIPGGRFRAVSPIAKRTGKTVGFELFGPPKTGLNFTNHLSDEAAAENQIRLNGSGVALGDVDGDSRPDIYLCGLENGNALFHNEGNMRFTDITSAAGVECAGQFSTGAVLVDIDGDRDLDLLVNGIGVGTRLFINDSKGHFTEKKASGLVQKWAPTSMTLADANGDGLLDLYVANYRTTTIRTTGFALLNVNGKKMIRPEDLGALELTPDGKVLEQGEPDIFYINEGGGKFTPVPWTAGGFLDEDGKPLKKAPRDWGLSAMFRDINQDGLPDLYVCNDFHSPDRIWLNTGEGSFLAAPRLMFRHTSTFSMSVDFADIDRDGKDDLFIADMLDPRRQRRMAQFSAMEPNASMIGIFDARPQYDRNTLQWNRGGNVYSEIAYYSGIEASGWSWCALFLDVDLDGYEDLLLTTGHMFDTQDLDAAEKIQAKGPWKPKDIPKKLLMFPRLKMPKMAFRNDAQLHFVPAAKEWGFSDEGVAHGMALADLDGDGDLDVVVNNLNAAAGIYENVTSRPRIWVQLKGKFPNTRAIGSRVRLVTDGFVQEQEIISGGRYLSSDDPARVFAWREGTKLARLEVQWRSGAFSKIENITANCAYELDEPENSSPLVVKKNSAQTPLFADVSASLSHLHHEEPFDDFERQPLLPKKLSQLGPGVAWHDLDGDGWDDLIIGSGTGGKISIFKNNGGTFTPWNVGSNSSYAGESGAVLGIGSRIVSSLSNYETPGKESAAVLFDAKNGMSSEFARIPAATAAIAAADYDANGEVDLFFAGRCTGGKYPAPANSLLLKQINGKWVPDEENSKLFKGIGLVSGAVFSDLNNDGFPELILVCEWGAVRVFQNERGKFTDATERLGLGKFIGWWNGVATCDLDEDGRQDIIVSNWGLNTKYRATTAAPLRIYYGDFQQTGVTDVLETYFDQGLAKETPERDLRALRASLPALAEKFSTYSSYANADVEAVLGDAKSRAKVVEANTLESMVFFNRGDHFEAKPLPREAQISPAFAVVCADFNCDGHSDLFLSQNFFPVEPTTSRNDAGLGLLMLGDGKGGLKSMSAEESGIAIFGEQRGAAACDFDHDGRLDLVVTQNGAATKLYRNIRAEPGLRIQLRGSPGNPAGFGAAVRVINPGHASPWREVQGGSGYWSENSSSLLFPIRQKGGKVEVRWPGGKLTQTEITPGKRDLTVTQGEN